MSDVVTARSSASSCICEIRLQSWRTDVGADELRDKVVVLARRDVFLDAVPVLAKADVVRTRLSEISPMLPNMINRLNPEELKDLLAYLKAGGNREDSLFRKK